MKDIFKLHWRFIKNPSEEIENDISQWPLSSGFALYILYLLRNQFQSRDSFRMLNDILINVYNITSEFSIYFYAIFSISFSLFIYYFFMPICVRLLSGQSINEFDPLPYRKLIFYSPTSFIIYSVYVLLPLQVIMSIYIIYFEAGIFSIILGLIYSLLGIWAFVLMINIFVIQWKGLRIFYNITGIKSLLLIFIIPSMGFIPMIIIYGHNFIEYVKNYVA